MTVEKQIVLPDIGDFPSVEVIEILVAVGDTVAEEDSLVSLESDKATMEIPSTDNGVVKSIQVSLGDSISQGAALVVLEIEDAVEATKEAPAADDKANESVKNQEVDAVKEIAKAPKTAPSPVAQPAVQSSGKSHASPSVRRFARELGVDLSGVSGSGSKGRILKEDVQTYVKNALANPGGSGVESGFNLGSAPQVDFTKFGDIEEMPLGRIKKISGKHLHRSWVGIPHVTQFDETDITHLEAFRKEQKNHAEKQGVKLTFMPFLMKAVASALKDFPNFNSSLSADTESLIMKKYINIGIAVDTPNGLMVPVVRNVDKKGVFELAAELMELSAKTRDGKLAPADMQGGCISISSLGGIGGTQFTPIVNSPEVAILGISRAAMKPVWNGKDFDAKLIMPFSLSYDHRVIDGAEGVRFTTYLGQLLGDIRKLLL